MNNLIKTSTGKLIKSNNILIKSPQPDVIFTNLATEWNSGFDKDYNGGFNTRGKKIIEGYVCTDINEPGHITMVSDYSYGLALSAHTQSYEMLVSYVDTNTTLTNVVAKKQDKINYAAIGDNNINWNSYFDFFISDNENSSNYLTRQEFINGGWTLLATIKFILDANGNPIGLMAWTTDA